MNDRKYRFVNATALSIAVGALLAPLHSASAQSADDEIRGELDALNSKIQQLEERLEKEQAKNSAAQESTAKAVADADKRAKGLPTVYGRIHVGLERRDVEGAGRVISGSAPGTAADQWETTSYSSRLGIRGEIELGSAELKAVYQAEYEIFPDEGSTTFSSRNIFAGLQSAKLGRIVAGRIDTPLKSAEGRVDQFNDQRGDLDNLIGGQNRPNNAVLYNTPTLGGIFTGTVAFYQAEGSDFDLDGQPDSSIDDGISASIVAESGIFYGALAYDSKLPARRSVDGFAGETVSDAIRFVGGVRSGIWEAGVLAQQSTDQTPGSDAEDTSYLVSGAVTLADKWKLKAQAGVSEGKESDEKGQLLAVGADFKFTPKVRAFTYYSTLDLDRADLKDNTFAVGLDVSF
jgi:predicted porin